MDRPTWRHVRRLAAPILAVALLVPVALATHEHEHRYMVMGRVLDSEGLPAALVPVSAELEGTEAFVASRADRTNCLGDFLLAFPIAKLGQASVRVTVGATEVTEPVDPLMRRTFLKLSVPGNFTAPVCEEERRNFTQRQTVTGRLLKGGAPRAGQEVLVILELADGGELVANGTTSEAGDFAVVFRSPRLGQGDRAAVTDGGETWSTPTDPVYGISLADNVQAGGSNPVWMVAGVFALLAAGAAAWLVFQRR